MQCVTVFTAGEWGWLRGCRALLGRSVLLGSKLQYPTCTHTKHLGQGVQALHFACTEQPVRLLL